MTFREWAQEKKIDKTFYNVIMDPVLSFTVNDRDTFSAAEMLAMLQIYLMSETESFNRELAIYNFNEAILNPWKLRLESHNTK